MRTRNLTTFLFGAKVTSRLPPQLEMAMVVRGTFLLAPGRPVAPLEGLGGGLLEQGPLTAEVFAEDDEDRVGGCLYPGDLADYKPQAEVFLIGSCHPPSGKPVRECGVRFSVGAWSKTLLVTGKRTWGTLGPSKAEPFETMPLGWTHSFGGPGYERNPSGKGLDTAELPNVEAPASQVTSKSDRPNPAGFGPLNPWWPQRAAKTGKAMHTARPPYFASGIDWTRFLASSPDQHLKGFLVGDESISLQNLHPDEPNFSARLPGLRIRAFAKDVAGAIREARMNLDTLLVHVDKSHLVLTWRGHVPCSESDLADVRTVLIASEQLADAPGPADRYRRLLDEFELDPVGVTADERVPGATKAMAAGKAFVAEMQEHPDVPPAERMVALLQNEDIVTFGVPEERRAETIEQAAARSKEIKAALEQEKKALAKQDEELAARGIPKLPASPPKTANQLAEEAPDVRAQMVGALKAARTRLDGSGLPPEPLEMKLKEIAEAERQLDDPFVQRGLAMATPPRAAEVGAGKDLSFRNMADRDFSGLDLSGANFEQSILTGARFVGARVAGARFRQALLSGADFTDADVSGADFTESLMSRAVALRAKFRGAILHKTVLSDANLSGAMFGEAKLSMVVLSKANAAGANLQHADLFMVFGEGATLEKADFSGAKIVRSTFMRCNGRLANFTAAALTKTNFMESQLEEAKFVEASGEQNSWMKTNVGRADFRFAVFHSAYFIEAQAIAVNFYGADLRDSRFTRACLDRSIFRKANLLGANFEKAELNETTFLDASLYEAKLTTARGKGTIFVGANTKKAGMPS